MRKVGNHVYTKAAQLYKQKNLVSVFKKKRKKIACWLSKKKDQKKFDFVVSILFSFK